MCIYNTCTFMCVYIYTYRQICICVCIYIYSKYMYILSKYVCVCMIVYVYVINHRSIYVGLIGKHHILVWVELRVPLSS